MMVRACATETKSVIFDLSPIQTAHLYNANRGDSDKMVALVMKCAKAYQPSIIYIDECEKIWPAK
jgi:ATP-dependent 26S proteasome regulatory subunit